LATLNEVIAGGMISWVLEADLKNFVGSLSHDWVLRFVEHRAAGAARSRRNLRQASRRFLLIRHADAQDYR